MGIKSDTIYIKIDQNTVCTNCNITLQDIAKMECTNEAALRQIKQKKLYTFPRPGEGAVDKETQENLNQAESNHGKKTSKTKKVQLQVFSILKVIELIHEDYKDMEVVNEGEKDFIVEYHAEGSQSVWIDGMKTIILCIIIFFGAAFTIMAFNNDISITDVFSKLYKQVMGTESSGMTELEFSYCIGLALGIMIFFNHVGKKKITHDPTPIQIELRKYEQDINTAFIENAERKGHSIDVK